MLFCGLVRQVTRGDDMRHGMSEQAATPSTLRQMNFLKCPVLPIKATERAQRFHHTGSFRPSASSTAREGYDSDCARCKCLLSNPAKFRVDALSGVEDFLRRNILDLAGDWQSILSESDVSGTQLSLDPFMLDWIEAVLFEQRVKGFGFSVATGVMGK